MAAGNSFDLDLLRRVVKYTRPHRGRFYSAVALTLFIAGISPLRPILVQYAIDNFITKPNPQMLLWTGVALISLVVFQALLQYVHTYLTNWLGQRVIHVIRTQLYTTLNRFKLQFFDRTPVGTLITRLVSDLEAIADIFSEGLIVIIGDILQLIVIIGVMFYIDWRLTLFSLCPIPLLIIATNIFKNGIKRTFNEVRTQVARLNTFVQEHITGMAVVQIFTREGQELEKFKEVNRLHRDANIRSIWYYSIFFPVVEVLSAASIGTMVWWGSREALNGTVSTGVMVSFIMYLNMLYRPIRELADKFNTLQMGMVSCERVFKLLDTESTEADSGTLKEEDLKGTIEFKDLWFAYTDEQWVLKGINLTVKEGEMLAVVGATGAGKSSIINLLNRFYKINKGSIRIGDHDIKGYPLHVLRGGIATVLQDVFLFSETIAGNISLHNPDIHAAQIVEAAKAVGAHDFIQRLPGGYAYNVQERGATLSTGQRQLISFIRAYVHNPKILVLDEATSSIDSESEHLIQEATLKLTQGRTSIIIAHRLATIRHADRIIVLDKGQIIEEGTHTELLQKQGAYHKLYTAQFEKQEVL